MADNCVLEILKFYIQYLKNDINKDFGNWYIHVHCINHI